MKKMHAVVMQGGCFERKTKKIISGSHQWRLARAAWSSWFAGRWYKRRRQTEDQRSNQIPEKYPQISVRKLSQKCFKVQPYSRILTIYVTWQKCVTPRISKCQTWCLSEITSLINVNRSQVGDICIILRKKTSAEILFSRISREFSQVCFTLDI